MNFPDKMAASQSCYFPFQILIKIIMETEREIKASTVQKSGTQTNDLLNAGGISANQSLEVPEVDKLDQAERY